MIDTILSYYFTDTVIAKMGDWYPVVYSWAAFSIVVASAILAIVSLIAFFKAIFKLFR